MPPSMGSGTNWRRATVAATVDCRLSRIVIRLASSALLLALVATDPRLARPGASATGWQIEASRPTLSGALG